MGSRTEGWSPPTDQYQLTHPLQRIESYTYNPNENLATFTDRKGQVTTYTYDKLNRLTAVGFGTQETVMRALFRISTTQGIE